MVAHLAHALRVVRSVCMSAFCRLHVVSMGVVARVAHEPGAFLAIVVVAHGHVGQCFQGFFIELEVLLAQVPDIQFFLLIVELVQKLHLLETNCFVGLALLLATLALFGVHSVVLKDVALRVAIEVLFHQLVCLRSIELGIT